MAGIDAILCLVGAFVPLSSIFLMLLVPLVSAAVSLFCKTRYCFIYVLGAIGVSLALSAWNVMNTVFYLTPGLLVGVTYGLLWKAKLPTSVNIFLVTLLSTGLFYLSFLLLRVFFDGVDMVNMLLTFIGRGNDPISRQIFPLFAFGYSLAQIAITHIFLVYELRRMGMDEIEASRLLPFYPLFAALFLALAFGLGFAYLPLAYFFLGLGVYWTVNSALSFYPRLHPFAIVLLVLTLGGSILLFATLCPKMPNQSGLLVLALPLLCTSLISSLNRLFLRLRDKKGPKPKRYE